MASLLLLVAGSALGHSVNSAYNYAGLYNTHNNAVLTASAYATVDLCKAADTSGSCTIGSISFSCSCDVREFVDEVNTRRCMHSYIGTTTSYDFRAIAWDPALAGYASGFFDVSQEVKTYPTAKPYLGRSFTVMLASTSQTPNALVEAFYTSSSEQVVNRMLYPGVHSIGCAWGIGTLACTYGYKATTVDEHPCEPSEPDACYDCNTYDAACAIEPVNPEVNRATCLACSKGDYTDVVSAPTGSAGQPDELTDFAIALIVIFSLFVLAALIAVVYKWKQILHWMAPFRPSLHWMKSETKASNIALARHETHIKVKRDTIKDMSRTKSVRHTMTMPVWNAHVDVAPDHPHGDVPRSTKAAHEHEMPPTYQNIARAKAASMRSRSVRFKGSDGGVPKSPVYELGESYL